MIDVSNNAMYQDVDIDFIVKMKSGGEIKVEVKTDTYKSGNMYYETVSAEETGSVGGFEKTECDFMLYYFVNLGILYTLEMNPFREWFNEREEYFIEKGYQKSPINKRYNGSTYTSIGYAFPFRLLDEGNYYWCTKELLNKDNYIGRI